MRASCTGPRLGARGGQKEAVDKRTKSEYRVQPTPIATSDELKPARKGEDQGALSAFDSATPDRR